MHSRPVHIKFSTELLKEIDKVAKSKYQSRSDFVRECVVLYLNNEHVVSHNIEAETEDEADEAEEGGVDLWESIC